MRKNISKSNRFFRYHFEIFKFHIESNLIEIESYLISFLYRIFNIDHACMWYLGR